MKDKIDKVDPKKEKDKDIDKGLQEHDVERPDKDKDRKCAPTEESIREDLMRRFVRQLPVLRVTLGLSQAETAQTVGISRQTYLAVEKKSRPLTWSTFLALFAFFYANEDSRLQMERDHSFLHEVLSVLDVKGHRNHPKKDKPKEDPEH